MSGWPWVQRRNVFLLVCKTFRLLIYHRQMFLILCILRQRDYKIMTQRKKTKKTTPEEGEGSSTGDHKSIWPLQAQSRDWRNLIQHPTLSFTHITVQQLQLHLPAYWSMCAYIHTHTNCRLYFTFSFMTVCLKTWWNLDFPTWLWVHYIQHPITLNKSMCIWRMWKLLLLGK